MKWLGRWAAVLVVAALALPQPTAAQTTSNDVALNLSLLVDVSGSVSTTEFNLQRTGYVNAFNSAAVWNAINSLPTGTSGAKIAVNLVYWASGATTGVGWTTIGTQAEAQAFATAVSNAPRPGTIGGATAPGTAINYAVANWSPHTADRGVIDVSGDGSQNTGLHTATERDAALADARIDKINGLAILGSEAGLQTWYQNNIQGGTNSFTLAANGFADFEQAVLTKLEAEIRDEVPVPEPTAMLLLASGLLGVGVVARRRRKELSE